MQAPRNSQDAWELLAAGSGPVWRDLLVEIFRSRQPEARDWKPGVPEPHLVYIVQGTMLFAERDLEGEWQQLQVGPGALFLTTSSAPYEVHWKRVGPDPVVLVSVYVGLPLLAEATRDLLGPGARVPRLREFSGATDPVLEHTLELLRAEVLQGDSASALLVQGLARALAVHLVRCWRDQAAPQTAPTRGLTVFDLHRVSRYLEDHLDQDVPLTQLAALVGMSEFHFSRVFKRAAGFSPSRYFIRLRMDRARRLLSETSRNILGIGLDVGYSSPSHFSRLFRRETGLTPTEYRSQF